MKILIWYPISNQPYCGCIVMTDFDFDNWCFGSYLPSFLIFIYECSLSYLPVHSPFPSFTPTASLTLPGHMAQLTAGLHFGSGGVASNGKCPPFVQRRKGGSVSGVASNVAPYEWDAGLQAEFRMCVAVDAYSTMSMGELLRRRKRPYLFTMPS